jgi:hypothetical protein
MPTQADDTGNNMELSDTFTISPSADPKSTALSIAWILVSRVEIKGKDETTCIKMTADLIGELVGRMLFGASREATPMEDIL